MHDINKRSFSVRKKTATALAECKAFVLKTPYGKTTGNIAHYPFKKNICKEEAVL